MIVVPAVNAVPTAGSADHAVAASLYYYVRVLEPLYPKTAAGPHLAPEPAALRLALVGLAAGALLVGILPQPWVALADRPSTLLRSSTG